MQITHLKRFEVQMAGVFKDVQTLDDLDTSIYEYGLSCGERGTEPYRRATGAAYEIYNQFFCTRYEGDTLLGIRDVQDTSLTPFNSGFDFTFNSPDGSVGLLQTKWHHNINWKFTEGELGTFGGRILDEGVQIPNNAILFTNCCHVPSKDNGSVFHYEWDDRARRRHRVFDRTMQEQFILRDPTFWNDLRQDLEDSCKNHVKPLPELWDHQKEVDKATQTVIRDGGRGRVVVATGGGKTLNEYLNVEQVLFEESGRLTVVVAPTRDLVDQHFIKYHEHGLFHKGVHAVSFKSGSEPPRDDGAVEFIQTTNGDRMVELLEDQTADKIHVCVTYKSFPVLMRALRRAQVDADLIIFDEFQHLVSQQKNEFGESNMRAYLHSLPASRILFYSASQKHGRILSAFDEKVFGPLLVDIPYKRLREEGILVPRLQIIPIRIAPQRIEGLSASLRRQAEMFQNVDPAEVYREAAGMIVAYEHASTKYPDGVNIITWSKKVAHLQMIMENPVVQARIGEDVSLHAVYAQVPSNQRRAVYETVRSSLGNVLGQHSCVNEGIDVPNLNVGYVARSLGIVSTQQGPGGRPTRAHPIDKERFRAGKLSIDDPMGWVKYSATVYVLVETGEDETFLDFMCDLIRKLQFAGLEESDYEFIDLVDQRTGNIDPDNDWMSQIGSWIELNSESLEDVISKARIILDQEEEASVIDHEVSEYTAKSLDQKFAEGGLAPFCD